MITEQLQCIIDALIEILRVDYDYTDADLIDRLREFGFSGEDYELMGLYVEDALDMGNDDDEGVCDDELQHQINEAVWR